LIVDALHDANKQDEELYASMDTVCMGLILILTCEMPKLVGINGFGPRGFPQMAVNISARPILILSVIALDFLFCPPIGPATLLRIGAEPRKPDSSVFKISQHTPPRTGCIAIQRIGTEPGRKFSPEKREFSAISVGGHEMKQVAK